MKSDLATTSDFNHLPTSELSGKRLMLFSVRTQLSSELQPVRELAVEKLVERMLLIAPDTTAGELATQTALSLGQSAVGLTRLDIQQALERLRVKGRLIASGKKHRRFHLTPPARTELETIRAEAEQRYARVIQRLFKATADPFSYSAAFLDLLSVIFSRLGEAYVRVLNNDSRVDEVFRSATFKKALQKIRADYQTLDAGAIEAAAYNFFRQPDPDYNTIKWNMGQNYYVAKALGLDESRQLLSASIFGGGTLYLDTNVIIAALEPRAEYHRTFQVLSSACKQFGIELKATQITLNELRNVTAFNKELLRAVGDVVPARTESKIRGIFYDLYREHRHHGPVDLDALFANFSDPRARLATEYGVEIVDSDWFTTAERDVQTLRLAEELKAASQQRRSGPKSHRPALHDALLLQWVSREREQHQKAWIVTLDQTLRRKGERSLALPLDALLQWISPLVVDGEHEMAEIFAEAVKYQVLPPENFFELRDFLVFANTEYACKNLPDDDVEECIRYVNAVAPELNPSDPSDREKIAREIAKYFTDPPRYKQELLFLEERCQQLERTSAEHLAACDVRIAQLTDELREHEDVIRHRDEELLRLNTLHAQELETRADLARRREAELVAEKERLRADHEHSDMTRIAKRRLRIAILVIMTLMIVVGSLAALYGDGKNTFQRILGAWQMILSAGGLGALVSYFIIGKQRLRLLREEWSDVFGKASP